MHVLYKREFLPSPFTMLVISFIYRDTSTTVIDDCFNLMNGTFMMSIHITLKTEHF